MKKPLNYTPRSRAPLYAFSIFLFVVCGYALFQSRNLILGPSLTITTPPHTRASNEPIITIEGVARNISFLSLNDAQIFVTKEGVFSEKLIVQPGYTIMKLAAQDRFGRIEEQVFEIFRDRPLEPTPLSPFVPEEVNFATENEDETGDAENSSLDETPSEVSAPDTTDL